MSGSRSYITFNYPDATPEGQTLLTGVREVDNAYDCHSEKVFISGFYKPGSNEPDQQVKSFVYKGKLHNQNKGRWYELYYPNSSVTNLYGPNNYKKGGISVVGNYVNENNQPVGCLYQGKLDGSGKWTSLIPPFHNNVYGVIAHSNMGGVVVGNYDYDSEKEVGKAFIYDIKSKEYYNIEKSDTLSITAYGIWHNGYENYTICGGYKPTVGVDFSEAGYLVDWDRKNKELYNWRVFHYNNNSILSRITHFDGITGDGKCGYNLTGDWLGIPRPGEPELAFFCNVNKKGKAKWEPIKYPSEYSLSVTSGNTVYKKNVIGVYTTPEGVNGYVSSVNK